MTALMAVDDGLSSGNLNWADVFFIVAAILAVLAAIGHAGVKVVAPLAGVLLAVAVGFVAFGLFLL